MPFMAQRAASLTVEDPRYQGCRPMAPMIQLILYHKMLVQVAESTRPPVSPLLAFHDQYAKPCRPHANASDFLKSFATIIFWAKVFIAKMTVKLRAQAHIIIIIT